MLLLDRFLGAHFFDTQAGGSAVLCMHFFWIFGHPEVYILVLPVFAFASEIIPVFSRKAIFGYPVTVCATVAIGFVSAGLWAHHMTCLRFATMPSRTIEWSSATTILILGLADDGPAPSRFTELASKFSHVTLQTYTRAGFAQLLFGVDICLSKCAMLDSREEIPIPCAVSVVSTLWPFDAAQPMRRPDGVRPRLTVRELNERACH
jgi:hypothetical protein